jgi:pimeloyl-ACP methyl ester carboxylesterase
MERAGARGRFQPAVFTSSPRTLASSSPCHIFLPSPPHSSKLEHVISSGFRAYAVDLRGHGLHSDAHQPPDPHRLTYEGMARDVLDVVDAAGWVGQVFVFGHSLGGAVAMHVETMRPGTFRGMYLFEPVIFTPGMLGRGMTLLDGDPKATDIPDRPTTHDAASTASSTTASTSSTTLLTTATTSTTSLAWSPLAGKPPGEMLLAASALARPASFPGGPSAALSQLCRTKPYKYLDLNVLRAYLAYGLTPGNHLRCQPETEARVYLLMESQTSFQLFERMAVVRCPVRVARGQRGTGVHDMIGRSTEFLAAQCAKGSVMVFDDLFHLGPLERPDRVGHEVGRFFADVVLHGDTCTTARSRL